jgi:hypothetical protein
VVRLPGLPDGTFEKKKRWLLNLSKNLEKQQ